MARITSLAPGKVSAARDRLLQTASALFYSEGVNSVGVDRIVSEAGVTRATFYRHFPSKQDLVLAYLQSAHDAIEQRASTALAIEDPRARLRALGEDIADQLHAPEFRGCAFIKAASEFADPDEPIRQAVAAHRAWFAEVVRAPFAEAGHPTPDAAMRHFVMLRDGAMAAGCLSDPGPIGDTLLEAVEGILRARG